MKFDSLRHHVCHASAGQVRSDISSNNGGVVVSPADMDGLSIRLSSSTRRPVAANTTSAERLREGDVLVSARGSVGKVAVVNRDVAGAAVSANVLVLRLKDSLRPQVLWAFLTAPPGRRALEAVTLVSAAQRAISLENLLAMRVPVPPAKVQAEIAAAVESGLRGYQSALEAAQLRLKILNQAFSQVFKETQHDGGEHGGT